MSASQAGMLELAEGMLFDKDGRRKHDARRVKVIFFHPYCPDGMRRTTH